MYLGAFMNINIVYYMTEKTKIILTDLLHEMKIPESSLTGKSKSRFNFSGNILELMIRFRNKSDDFITDDSDSHDRIFEHLGDSFYFSFMAFIRGLGLPEDNEEAVCCHLSEFVENF